jgi:HK97 family phage major capsid protein
MASEVAKSLRDRRQQAWHEAKALLDTSATENRSLTAEEEGKWSALNGEIDKIDERLKAVLDAEERSRETDDVYNRLSGRTAERPSGGADAVREELRSWMIDRANPGPIEIRRGKKGSVNTHYLSSTEYRTLLSNNTSSASSTVPIDFYDQLIAYLIEVSGLLQAGPSVLNTAGGETVQIPVASAHITGASAAQGAGIPTADPAFGQRTLSAVKFGALTYLSRELIDDTAVDLLGYLAMSAGRAIGNTFGSALINGTNGISGGVLSGVTVGVTGSGSVSAATGTNGGPTYNNLVDLEYSVIAPYRQSRSCYWMAADKTIGGLRKLVDGNSRPIWEPSAVLGAPDLLLGKPLVADPFMPALGVTGVKSLAFGDFSQYFVRLVGGLRFERSDDFQFGSDLVTFRALLRGDGNWGDTSAVKLFQASPTA